MAATFGLSVVVTRRANGDSCAARDKHVMAQMIIAWYAIIMNGPVSVASCIRARRRGRQLRPRGRQARPVGFGGVAARVRPRVAPRRTPVEPYDAAAIADRERPDVLRALRATARGSRRGRGGRDGGCGSAARYAADDGVDQLRRRLSRAGDCRVPAATP